MEGDDVYIKQVILEIENLILDGGRHVLCSTDIMGDTDQANPPEKETTNEDDKFSVIYLLQTAYPVIYGNLNKELQNGSYARREKIQLLL